MRQLEALHGSVRHIGLGTVALEHKATLGPFAQYFANTATVWLQPGQWSFPVQLPIEYLGVVQKDDKLRVLPSSQFLHGETSLESELASIPEKRYRYWARKSPVPEWLADIDYETLGPLKFKSVGAYSETAFFHKATRCLVVTDCVCSVTRDAPPIIQEDPRALLFHARDSIDDIVADDLATRRKGWRRMVQFGFVFFPSRIDAVPVGRALRDAAHLADPAMAALGADAVPTGRLYPWTWRDGDADVANFDALARDGTLFCPPILTKLILDREPVRTLEWVDRIARRFDFTHVVPGHLNNYVGVAPGEFERAFDPLRSAPREGRGVYPQRALAEDLALLQEGAYVVFSVCRVGALRGGKVGASCPTVLQLSRDVPFLAHARVIIAQPVLCDHLPVSASDLLTQLGVVAPSQICDLEPARKVGRFASIAPK